jgi:hypothetical protein
VAELSNQLIFSRSRFAGKERDTETGNDYFGAKVLLEFDGAIHEPGPWMWLMNELKH